MEEGGGKGSRDAVRGTVAMPQVRALPLLKDTRRHLNGNRLRQFLVEIAACRTHMVLPENRALSWEAIGIDLGPEYKFAFASLHDLLRGCHYVLALPEANFRKTSWKFTLRQSVLENKKVTRADVLAWAARLVQFDVAFAELAKASPGKRTHELALEITAAKRELWDRRFVYGSKRPITETQVGYQPPHALGVAGRSKADITKSLKELHGVGEFYTEHAIILLCGGSAEVLSKMRVRDVQDSVTAGRGSSRLAHLLLQEDVGMQLTSMLNAQDYGTLILRERDRFRAQGLAVMAEGALPYCLQKRGGHYVAVPECFADMLCESAQLLLTCGGRKAARTKASEGWRQLSESGVEMAPQPRAAGKRPR